MALPRGIRLNNPGNIEITKIKWKGKVVPSADPRFEQFVSPEMGIRAIARDLLTGYKRGEDTVVEIIHAWAPSIENNTPAYIAAVCRALGCRPETKIDVDDYATMAPLVKAIIRHENGDPAKYGRPAWYSDEEIRAALFDAGVSGAPGKAPGMSTEARGAQAAASGGAGVTVIEATYDALDKIEPAKEMLLTLAPTLTLAKYALLTLTLLGAAVVAYGLIQKYRAVLA